MQDNPTMRPPRAPSPERWTQRARPREPRADEREPAPSLRAAIEWANDCAARILAADTSSE
jgi:hypothetical protein